MFRLRDLQEWNCPGTLNYPIHVDVDAECVRREFSKFANVRADSTTNVQDPAIVEGRETMDQGEPSVLTKTPDVAWVTERDPLPIAGSFQGTSDFASTDSNPIRADRE